MPDNVCAILMAAGKSTRMQTDLPKVLHEVCGRPMLAYVIEACAQAGVNHVLVVVGYGREKVQATFADFARELPGDVTIEFVTQEPQLGTGHAVMVCEPHIPDSAQSVVILAGDGPLIRSAVVRELIDSHHNAKAAVTLATARLPQPAGYGRILRNEVGQLTGIVEHNDCTPEQREIDEVNPSYYCFDAADLRYALGQITNDNAKGEYYLTDAVHLLIKAGKIGQAVSNVDASDVLSINTRQQLAEVSQVMQQRIHSRHMDAGVTIEDPATTWIDSRVTIGQDTILRPMTCIDGPATIGRDCRVGPFAHVAAHTRIGDGAVIAGSAPSQGASA